MDMPSLIEIKNGEKVTATFSAAEMERRLANLRRHMASKEDFTAWLTTTYLFYFVNRLVDVDGGAALLPQIHARTRTRARVSCPV